MGEETERGAARGAPGGGACALCDHPSELQFSHKEMACPECDRLVYRGFAPGPCAGPDARAFWRSTLGSTLTLK